MKAAMYESEATKFIREVLEKNPQIVEQQKKNRATWWDKPQDLETSKERSEAAVPTPPYVYFPLPVPEKDVDPDSGKRLSTPSKPT
jgi:hypothetical protein